MNLSYPNGFDSAPLVIVRDATRILRIIQLFMIPAIVIQVLAAVIAGAPLSSMVLMGSLAIVIPIAIEIVIRVFGPRWRKVYTVDSSMVLCETSEGSWTEDLDNYRDVHWFTETRGSGKNRSTYQVVELRHNADKTRNIRLVDNRSQAGVRAKWETAAKLVRRPASKDLGGGRELRREVDDLDLSIRDLVEKGTLVDDFDPSKPVPGGIRWHQQGGRLEVRLRRSGVFYLLIFAAIGIMGGIFAIATEGEPLVVIGLLAAIGLVAVIAVFQRHHLVIEGPNLTSGGRLFGIPYRPAKTLALDEIETITAGSPKSIFTMVNLESDRMTFGFGPVSAKGGQWLEKFLISAIATAPRG